MDELSRIAGQWKAVTRWRISEFDPPHRQDHLGEGVAMARDMAVIIEVAPAAGGSEFTLALCYTPRFGAIGLLVEWEVVPLSVEI